MPSMPKVHLSTLVAAVVAIVVILFLYHHLIAK